MDKEEVIEFIQNYCYENVFDITYSPRRNRKHDEWKEQWTNQINAGSDEARARQSVQRIQEAVRNHFGAANILIEEPLTTLTAENTSHRFDIYIPSERCAIEICTSAIKNEFEKDLLKAMLDSRTTSLYILARDYVSGIAETHYGVSNLERPGNRSFIELVKTFKLEVIPEPLCPIQEN